MTSKPRKAPAAIEASGVVIAFGGTPVLDGVSVKVNYGQAVSLVGRNGSGKSTLLRAIGGLLKPDAGTVRIAGVEPSRAGPQLWRDVVMLLGDEAWYPDLTVIEHLQLLRAVHAPVPGDIPEPADLLEAMGLTERADVVPAVLSSGQRQRLMLAAALCRPSKVLMLDEPEQRLDTDIRPVLAELLRERVDAGAALLLASHDKTLIDGVGARVRSLDKVPE
ncbi:ABC transporter ATP-binding protein [Fodinicola acaciae]|uniref:ABC transporter ATP-binding protein n=1 Tax=Fodinicola acaciae TaxID=2681555 RepID=UPI0013D5F7AB|nr:ABC transporter ATP-binding protein [Fodinicola acaciae]